MPLVIFHGPADAQCRNLGLRKCAIIHFWDLANVQVRNLGPREYAISLISHFWDLDLTTFVQRATNKNGH